MLRVFLLLFVVLPIVDLFVMFRLGERFGFLEVIAAAIVIGALGAALAKREGLRVLERWNRALAEGRAPEESVLASGLLLLAGLLMIMPGFLSDVLGIVLVIPQVRSLIARLVRARFESGIAQGSIEVVSFGDLGRRRPPGGPARRGNGHEDIVDVEGEDITDSADSSRPRLPRDRGE